MTNAKRISCGRCGHKFTLDGYLAETRNVVRIHCRCGGVAVHRPDGRSCHVESREVPPAKYEAKPATRAA